MCTTLINENNVKPIAIYVHGLGSGAASTTVRMVCKIFSEYEWIAIEVNENPFESVEKINATVSKFSPSLLMGTSLGGYYVFYADAPCATKVICNPAMNIAKLIRYKIGFGTYSYFVERQDGNTEYTLDEAVCYAWQYGVGFRVRLPIIVGFQRRTPAPSSSHEFATQRNIRIIMQGIGNNFGKIISIDCVMRPIFNLKAV